MRIVRRSAIAARLLERLDVERTEDAVDAAVVHPSTRSRFVSETVFGVSIGPKQP